jgi:beta-N-acetylhexosaminidase
MKGVAGGFGVGEAAIRSIEAGTDVLLMPPDPDAAIRAVAAAVKSKRLTVERINRSLERVLNAKRTVGLDRVRFIRIEDIEEVIDTPEAADKAQEVANTSATLLRNEGAILPLKPGDGACALLLTENRYAVQGQVFIDEFKRLSPQTRVISLDPLMTATELDAAGAETSDCAKLVLGAFTSISSYRSGDALPGEYGRLVDSLLASGKPVVLVSLGSPYLIRRFPNVQAYLTTYSPVSPCESAAARALFGELKTTGRLPVTIPGLFQYGEGLQLP